MFMFTRRGVKPFHALVSFIPSENIRKPLGVSKETSDMRWVNALKMNSPANIYLFKVNNRNTRKGVKYVQS